MSDEQNAALNTDREIWREIPDDFYSPSIHVTEGGGIGMNVGGYVCVLPVREWHKLATKDFTPKPQPENLGHETQPADRFKGWSNGCSPEPSASKCPTCNSPKPQLHPATALGGECGICPNDFHKKVTAENTPEMIAKLFGHETQPEKVGDVPEQPITLIAAERARQISAEGWTPGHDDQHDGNQIAMAAACYASPVPLNAQIEVPCGCREAICPHSAFGKHMWVNAWPWEPAADKRKKHDRIRQLVIAGALIVAEIERLQRKLERS